MISLFLEILAQITGFLSIIVFPLSTLFLKILDKMLSKTEAGNEKLIESQSLSTNPVNTVPPWLKDITDTNEPKNVPSVIENKEDHVNSQLQGFEDEKLTSSLAREVFFVKEEPKIEKLIKSKTETIKKETEKKKLTLEDLLAERIKNAQFRILLKLPPKAKLRVLGRDWEVDTENTFIEISTTPPQVVSAQNKMEIEKIELPKEPWKLTGEETEKKKKGSEKEEATIEEEELEEEDWELENYG